MSSLYVLEINSLSIALFANIFSHSGDGLFVLFMVSFAAQKLLSMSHLFILIFIILGGGQKRSCCDLWQSVLPLFSSKSFIVFGFTMRGKAPWPTSNPASRASEE